MNNGSNYLVHYGVPGMKWGVRRSGRFSESKSKLVVRKSNNGNGVPGMKWGVRKSNNGAVAHRVVMARRALSDSDVSDIIKKYLNDHI